MNIKIVYRRILESLLIISVIFMPVAYSFIQASLLESADEQERLGKLNAIYGALDDSQNAYSTIPDVRALRAQGEEDLQRAEQELLRLGKEKYEKRLLLADRLSAMQTFIDTYGVDPNIQEEIDAFLEAQGPHLRNILKQYARLQYINRSHTGAFGVLATMLTGSLSDHVQEQSRFTAMRQLRMVTFADATAMQSFSAELAVLQGEYDSLLQRYHGAMEDIDAAKATVALSDARLAEIKRIVAKVDQKIRQMQVELAAYDERIRTRAENDLLEKGLISGPLRRSSPFSFQWPVVGRITAGFLDAPYMQYFGVPHKAVDIAQQQGSPVQSASDGIVYYVQHGGSHGYSYVLVGHQRGYATLYGHLSAIYVSIGDDVYAGQVLGLSGGQPGTSGAGPMTTGAHVHFEVIHNGVHVDPQTVLP